MNKAGSLIFLLLTYHCSSGGKLLLKYSDPTAEVRASLKHINHSGEVRHRMQRKAIMTMFGRQTDEARANIGRDLKACSAFDNTFIQ